MSVTVSGNQSCSCASAGDGNRLQSVAGRVSTAPFVVCANVADAANVQSQATMVPGADEVLPSKVHASVAPPFAIEHVSVSVVPETPKLAIATVGRVTDRTADAEAPPYEPVIVFDTVAATVRVDTVNVALVAPAATSTVAGTVASLPPVSKTDAPAEGAAAVSVAVPITKLPPTTVAVLKEIDDSVAAATAGGTTTTGAAGAAVGELGDPPHRATAIDASSMPASTGRGERGLVITVTSCPASPGPCEAS